MGNIIRTDNARGHDSEAHKDYAARSRVEELGVLFEKTFRSKLTIFTSKRKCFRSVGGGHGGRVNLQLRAGPTSTRLWRPPTDLHVSSLQFSTQRQRQMADETLPPNLQNVLDQKSLKWIFCGMFLFLLHPSINCFSNLLMSSPLVQVEREA
jgi:hypothetical protein